MSRKREPGSGKFQTLMEEDDLSLIRQLLREGKTERQVRMAIMRARNVIELTARNWIKKAKEEGDLYAEKTDEK